MPERVAIVGLAQTKYEAEKRHQHITEMVFEAVRAALDDAGMEINEIDNIVSCSQDFIDGRTISNRTIPEVEGAYLKSEAKVVGDGLQAVIFGALRIFSGKYRTTLVLAHAKMSEGSPNLIANAMFEPIYQRHLGLDDISAAALQARAYLQEHSLPEEVMALPAVHSLTNGADNPLVPRRRKVTPDEVMASPLLSSPLRELMAMPPCDGACALILAAEDKARQGPRKPVWLAGFGLSTDTYYLGDRNLARLPELEEAAARAFRMAGISDPGREINLVELTDYFAHQSLMILEAMGFARPGEGRKLFESGAVARRGRLPVNASGGVLSGNPLCVAGLTRVIECVRQLEGRAGECQAGEPRWALAQGGWGLAGQSQAVAVLSRE